jgi:type I restriction enzyme S subunit
MQFGKSGCWGCAHYFWLGEVHVACFKIPLTVRLQEQRRIAAILDRADALRAKRREALAQLDSLTQSIFIEMFGDPVENPKGWPTKPLGEIVRVRRGGSPRPIDQFLGGTINWIKIGDATKGDDIYISKCAEKITEAGLRKTVFLNAGSLIFANCGVSLGFARILKVDGCIHDGWLSFDEIDEKVLNKFFLLKALNSVTERFRAMAPDGTQPNLNTALMKNFSMILPPVSLQDSFAKSLDKLREIKKTQETSLSALDSMFSSLQHRAFQGEL